MDAKTLHQDLLGAVERLKLLGADDDARILKSDVLRAGHRLPDLLMVRDDAERLLEAASVD